MPTSPATDQLAQIMQSFVNEEGLVASDVQGPEATNLMHWATTPEKRLACVRSSLSEPVAIAQMQFIQRNFSELVSKYGVARK